MKGVVFLFMIFFSLTGMVYAEKSDKQLDKEIEDLEKSIHRSFQKLGQMKRSRQPVCVVEQADITNIPLAFKQAWFQKDYLRYPCNAYNRMFRLAPCGQPWDLELHAWFQVDADYLFDAYGLQIFDGNIDFPATGQNTVMRYFLRRARPSIQGQLYGFVNYFFNIEFGLNNTSIYDAFVDFNYYRLLGLQVGKQMSLVSGIENYFDNFDYLSRAYTMEVSSSAMLAPDRQVGVVAHGSFGPSGCEPYFTGLSMLGFDDMFSYQFGWLTDTPDNYVSRTQYNYQNQQLFKTIGWKSSAFEARFFLNPFINRPGSIFHHLGFGFAGSAGHPADQGNLPSLTSPALNPIFNYQTNFFLNGQIQLVNVVADGSRTRIRPQVVWGYGPLGLLADWVQSKQVLALKGSLESTPQYPVRQKNTAQQLTLIYNLTQEEFNLFHFIPNRPFHLFERGALGGWQAVLGFAGLNLDPSVFKSSYQQSFYINEVLHSFTFYNYADPRLSVQKANSWSIGLNWYWNQFLRITAEYNQTNFVGGCSTGGLYNTNGNTGCMSDANNFYSDIYLSSSQVLNRPTEKNFMARLQLQF